MTQIQKQVYRIEVESRDFPVAYIEARDADEAWELAAEIDGGYFRVDLECSTWSIESVTPVTDYDPDLLVPPEAYGSL